MSGSGEGQARWLDARRVGVLFVLVCTSMLAVVLFGARPAFAAPSPPGPSALMPSSSTLNFYSQDMHDQSTLQVSFTNTSANPTTVSQAAIVGPDASSYSIAQDSCSQQTIQPNNNCFINVTFYALPTGPGPKNATLTVTDDNGTYTGTNDIALSGTAITGTLSADQNTLNFGGLVINQGNSNQQHVTISDDLSASVNVSNVQITGADASSFYVQNNGCPSSLQRGNTCQIYVQFQPNSAGPQTAQLEIDNDGNTNPLTVSLTGDGLTGPAVTVTPRRPSTGTLRSAPRPRRASRSPMTATRRSRSRRCSSRGLPAGIPDRRQQLPQPPDRFGRLLPCHGRVHPDRSGRQRWFPVRDQQRLEPRGHDDRPRRHRRRPGARHRTGPSTSPAPPGREAADLHDPTLSAGNQLLIPVAAQPQADPRSTRQATVARRRRCRHSTFACRVTATGPGGSQTVTSRATSPTRAQFAIDTTSVSGDTITPRSPSAAADSTPPGASPTHGRRLPSGP